MKHLSLVSAFVFTVGIGAFSCSSDNDEETLIIDPVLATSTLSVSMPGNTRIAIGENDNNGNISLKWQSGDQIKVGDEICSMASCDGNTAIFNVPTSVLYDGVAVQYPITTPNMEDRQTAVENSFNPNFCLMTGEITVQDGNYSCELTHEKAFIRISVDADCESVVVTHLNSGKGYYICGSIEKGKSYYMVVDELSANSELVFDIDDKTKFANLPDGLQKGHVKGYNIKCNE